MKDKTGDLVDIALLRRVLSFAKPYKFQFIIAAFSAIFADDCASYVYLKITIIESVSPYTTLQVLMKTINCN